MPIDPAYLNRPVRIVNAQRDRVMYAHPDANWQNRIGAGPGSGVHEDGAWLITFTEDGYRITNAASNRVLYAHANGDYQNQFGAGSPEDHVTEDGNWDITGNAEGSYRIVNLASQRWLYAHAQGAWEERVGAATRIDHRVGSAEWYFVFVAMDAEQ